MRIKAAKGSAKLVVGRDRAEKPEDSRSSERKGNRNVVGAQMANVARAVKDYSSEANACA